jgi:pimeloyl-ACP methyl ester carboxylesterase
MTRCEMDDTMTEFLARSDGAKLAFRQQGGRGPGFLWLGGFRSDMNGTKAEALAGWAARHGRAFLRFDYYGHGQSSGRFEDGGITRWRDDALAVLDDVSDGPQVLIGSSMGGWIATLVAHARPERIAALVLIAPAPDLTEDLMWARMPAEVRQQIVETGSWLYRPQEGEAYLISRQLIESGRANLVLNRPLKFSGPVRILHGTADVSVPWQHGARLLEVLPPGACFTLVKGAAHAMSEPAQLRLIEATLESVLQEMSPC